MKTPAFEDTDTMYFGKHKGKLLSEVPASYLHWWYHNADNTEANRKLMNYIENSLEALKDEEPDLIWKLRT